MAGADSKIFSGSANPALAEDIARHAGKKLGSIEIGRFADGEIRIVVHESVRGCDVFVVQPTCAPVNESIMELLLFIDALKRASAESVTAVIPWYGYSRQDHKSAPREPISAKLIANLITAAGADRVVSLDLHSGPIQGFFDIPVDSLTAIPIMVDYIRAQQLGKLVVVSPDAGGVKRAKKFADVLGAEIAVVNKFRPKENVAQAMSVIGDVEGKTAIIVDDMIDTAGSICTGAEALKECGAGDIYVCATHALLNGSAVERINKAPIKKVIVTDTIPIAGKESKKLHVLSVAPLLAETIRRINAKQSVSAPFSQGQTSMSTFI